MSGVYQPRNQAVGNSAGRTPLRGQPPKATDVVGREPPRASTPTGPLVRDRLRNFRRPPAPSLEVAEATVMPFGKFHDHTLGQIAAFEPSYIDWVAGTVNHDPDLVGAARVIQARSRSARDRPARPSGRRAQARPRAAPDGPRSPARNRRKREIAPRYRRATMTRMNSDELLPPRRSPGLLAEDQLLGS